MKNICNRIGNKIAEDFWKSNDFELALKTGMALLIYFGGIFLMYLKFIYRVI